MNRFVVACGAAAVLMAAFTEKPRAQRPESTYPVIVVFRDDASLESLATLYRADERTAANPRAWSYINRGVGGAVQALERRDDFRAEHVYSAALRGFSARLTARQIAVLEDEPSVAAIEPDGRIFASAQTLTWGVNRVDADVSSTAAGNGSGAVTKVHVYVIDTGIATHADLNQVSHVNFVGGPETDCYGHGTHVAGTAAAIDNTSAVVGVAPGARLIGVKVLDCSGSGSSSYVIKGIDWVAATAIKPAVANISLVGTVSRALDTAVTNAADSGVFFALAAGNNGESACNTSPARAGTHRGVMTVAATDRANQETSWSNCGRCVDIHAPGDDILSTRMGGGTTRMSGTSMASPHVAGAAALYLSSHAAASPATVEAALKANAFRPYATAKNGAPITLLNVGPF